MLLTYLMEGQEATVLQLPRSGGVQGSAAERAAYVELLPSDDEANEKAPIFC